MACDSHHTFTPYHQALLFSWLAREVIERAGEERGADILRKAVWRYGEQRGQRMAGRAQAHGHPLDWISYLAYGEWRAPAGWQESETVATSPDLRRRVTRCPWHDVWREQELLPYGRHYCLTIDEAIAHGFNPRLDLQVLSTLTNGASSCDFVFCGADLDEANQRRLESRREQAGPDAVRSWSYHTGHVWKTVGQVIVEEMGDEGREAVQAAMRAFRDRFGREMAAIIEAYADVDFGRV